MSNDASLSYEQNIKRFCFRLACVLTCVAAIPWLIALASTPPGSVYIGSQFSSDDQMVYAAWMHQAMEGRFLFDNRFAIESQPGLTIHLYFWVLGILCVPLKGLGSWVAIPLVSNLARLAFTFLFVVLLGRFARKLELPIFVAKTGLILSSFGAGLGFMAWQAFGQIGESDPFLGLLEKRSPIDVWQPEAFVFPSALVNGLFMVSLCLIITVFTAVWQARQGWRPVATGAAAMALLMNIHSYDVLIVAFSLAAFAGVCLVRKEMDWNWALRAAVIGAAAIPPALWFMHVLKVDPVFQARAATLTYSGTYRQLLFGILPLFSLGVLSFRGGHPDVKKWYGPALLALVVGGLFVGGTGYDPDKGYYLPAVLWVVALAGVTVLLGLARKDSNWQFLASWAAVSLVLPYFPQLFQRKLAMGMAIPWGFLAAYGFEWACQKLRSGSGPEESFRIRRNVATGLVFLLSCATSLYWFQRETLFIRNDVTSTTVQPVFLPSDVPGILRYLDSVPGRKVLVARPGVPGRSPEDPWGAPYLPDLNPVVSGFTGAYTYAGHWSETPDYANRRKVAEGIFRPLPPEQVKAFIKESQADYLIQPLPQTFTGLPSGDLSGYGEVVFEGRQFRLIRVDKSTLN